VPGVPGVPVVPVVPGVAAGVWMTRHSPSATEGVARHPQ
jgi:hypothetical protein